MIWAGDIDRIIEDRRHVSFKCLIRNSQVTIVPVSKKWLDGGVVELEDDNGFVYRAQCYLGG